MAVTGLVFFLLNASSSTYIRLSHYENYSLCQPRFRMDGSCPSTIMKMKERENSIACSF